MWALQAECLDPATLTLSQDSNGSSLFITCLPAMVL